VAGKKQLSFPFFLTILSNLFYSGGNQFRFKMLVMMESIVPWENIDNQIWGIVIEVICVFYAFIGLGVVCEDFLVPSLETLTLRWEIPEDVAGATFMTIGSSTPEILINTISTLKAQPSMKGGHPSADRVLGISTIIGSGMIAFSLVPALCGIVSVETIELKRRPIVRDQFFYLVALSMLIYFVHDGEVQSSEAGALIITYLVYLIVVVGSRGVRKYWNSIIRCQSLRFPLDDEEPLWADFDGDNYLIHSVIESPFVLDSDDDLSNYVSYESPRDPWCRAEELSLNRPTPSHPSAEEKFNSADSNVIPILKQAQLSLSRDRSIPRSISVTTERSWQEYLLTFGFEDFIQPFERQEWDEPELWKHITMEDFDHMGIRKRGRIAKFKRFLEKGNHRHYYKCAYSRSLMEYVGFNLGEEGSITEGSFYHHPGVFERVLTFFTSPVRWLIHLTLVDCTIHESWYGATLVGALIWVGAFSFLISSIVNRWVFLSHVPMVFFGLVLVSLGAEIPDMISSTTVTRKGLGRMALANCQGAQVLNLCIGLGMPWLIDLARGNRIMFDYHSVVSTYFLAGVLAMNFMILQGPSICCNAPSILLNTRKSVLLLCVYVSVLALFGMYVYHIDFVLVGLVGFTSGFLCFAFHFMNHIWRCC